MLPLITAASSADVRTIVDTYYDMPYVQGFALGVHGAFVSMYRSEFGRQTSLNDMLSSRRTPKAWDPACRAAGFSVILSPIYVVIYVTMRGDDFRARHAVPQYTPVDHHMVIIETKGPFIATADRNRHRPIEGGISVGNAASQRAGTLGGLFQDTLTSGVYVLSCNHVLCDSGGTTVVQQGASDGGRTATDSVGTMTHAVPLKAPAGFSFSAPYNAVDAALAQVDGVVTISRSVRLMGPITRQTPKAQIQLGDDVVFVGKESDRQEARVYRYISRLKVAVLGTVHNFGDVFEVEPRRPMYFGSLSVPGDSGSWVVNEANPTESELYGLLIAGNGRFSICCFIETVTAELNALGAHNFDLA